MKKHLLLLVLSFVMIVTVSIAQKPEIFTTDGKAIHGYDAVSFHKEGRAEVGKVEFITTWKEAKWLFANQANLDSFKESPEKYAPQYGGYCAYGMSNGYKASTMIDTWTIVDGKLYLNYNQQVKSKWNEDRLRLIGKADENWRTVRTK